MERIEMTMGEWARFQLRAIQLGWKHPRVRETSEMDLFGGVVCIFMGGVPLGIAKQILTYINGKKEKTNAS